MSENLLRFETSPYLLQHRDNPVHWRPWSAAALEAARAEDKPILLSVGYAACHWCHVMAHESFEDVEIAALMNRLYVNIKVDREERPDIDQIYMAALAALGDQGGWPLTMFLTPAGRPIWGGTYFPKSARYGRPGFADVLAGIERLYRQERGAIEAQAATITAHIASRAAAAGPVGPGLVARAAATLLPLMDPVRGGTRGAPKFPNVPVLDFLARTAERTADPATETVVSATLAGLADGGIFDHVGGGFARYSTDERWLVPHFEKMLYDNGLIIEQFALALAGSPRAATLRDRIEATVGWLLRELRLPGGAFAAGLDADSEGEEGRFYLWTRAELDTILPAADAAFVAELYDITAAGNFEGRSIPNRLASSPPLAAADEARRRRSLDALLARRETRIRPVLDDQVLADWNGHAIAGLATAGLLLDRPDWIAAADAAFAFVTGTMAEQGRPAHVWCRGRRGVAALSTDLASLARAALALHQATGRPALVGEAERLLALLERHHGDGAGSFSLAPDDGDALIARRSERLDEATPNAHGLAAEAHVRLWALTGAASHREAADRILAASAGAIEQNVFGTASLLSALDLRLNVATATIIADTVAAAEPLKRALLPGWRRGLVLDVRQATDTPPPGHPASGKGMIDGRPTAYLCREGRCSLPVTEPAALAALAEAELAAPQVFI